MIQNCGKSSIGLISVLIAIVLSGMFTSCAHRPLEDPYNGHYIRIYIDEQIKNVTYGFYNESRKRPEYKRPTVLRVVLSDPLTNQIVSERYLQSSGEDERGYYIDGLIAAEAGKYNLMIYNFGTERTKLRKENNFYEAQAYTMPIPGQYHQYFPTIGAEIDKNTVRYCPDHLFLSTSEPVEVGRSLNVDTLRTADGDFFTASSVVKSYYIQVQIRGFQYVSTAVSLLSGMAGTATLHNRGMVSSDPVSVFFDLDYTDVRRAKNDGKDVATLYTTFNTFGKLPEEQNMYTLNFEFTRSDGTTQIETIDITSMFSDPIVINEQWILLEKEIDIIPPIGGGGGMTPGVDEWGDIWSDIQL